MPSAPVLHTDRLTLRAHRADDLPACFALWSDPNVTRHIGGKPNTREEVWARLLRNAGHWALLGFGYWVLEETSSGRFVGEAGFADLKRDIEPSLEGLPEIGWVVVPAMQGHGYATEAVHALLAWGGRELGPGRSVCIIDPENAPSLRVAEKTGYRERARTTYHGAPTIVFERDLPAPSGGYDPPR